MKPCPFDRAIREGRPLPDVSIRYPHPPRGHSYFFDSYREVLAYGFRPGFRPRADCIAEAARRAAARMIAAGHTVGAHSPDRAADGQPSPDNQVAALRAIAAEMDGTEWGPETCDAIAEHLRRAGFTIREPGEVDDEDGANVWNAEP